MLEAANGLVVCRVDVPVAAGADSPAAAAPGVPEG